MVAKMNIQIKPMTEAEIPLWQQWSQVPHVKEVWFIAGYEPVEYIHQKIAGNGYDYPFIIFADHIPIGYIVCCDLYAYRTLCPAPKGLFTNEEPGTFCMDLFIADDRYLNKGYGTQIVKQFTDMIFTHFKAKIIYIDPSVTNKRAIRCYEKAGFQPVRTENDGVCECLIMQLLPLAKRQ